MQPNGSPDCVEGFSLPDVELASKVEAYLAGIEVTDHNPAILFSWDNEALEEFVQAANSEADGHPLWFSQPRGSVSPSSITSDIIGYLAQLGGGRCDHVLLAPNSLIQYGHLQERLQYMQYDEFMQKCMSSVTSGKTLARNMCHATHSIILENPTIRQITKMLVLRVRCVDDGRELLLERHGADEQSVQVAELKRNNLSDAVALLAEGKVKEQSSGEAKDAVNGTDELVAMGFERGLVQVMYESCGKDERLTANALLQTLES
ncbi:hypothetical protein BBO99_00000710 [Phytophthora kernoviae]|uniref:UBA domain-containing protein n=2 Tax=Phytophthora kernoviae TaxID=325452 RepID=A0A3R7K7C8_9STRA|nr:hypothetical protein G195_003202 [Phytophthora kernoviae 00238/432]KAG2524672.1 hypothetical protein JM16_004528 [Phytophthora kernoviae]KAG2525980.1 hypothetical protein JM18_004497 [Phytophthora kernoviae]RLN27368.1 hypothetical protein BBI17_002747 [Phytophthora kernoviae]RLN85257.1 hypothetical protein BBO99_00000710 [Phytophthora kernoviae]